MNYSTNIEVKSFISKVKCEFWLNQIVFLGHVVCREGIAMNLSKVEAVINWLHPSNIYDVKSFLSLAGYYKIFICKFSTNALSITQLLQRSRNLSGVASVKQVS